MKRSHVFDPENIAVLESEDRKVWQNPNQILNFVEIKRHFVAADLGCGTGFFTVPLSLKVKKVYGIDVQKEMLGVLGDKMKKLRIRNIELLLSTPNEIPLENESVNLLISVNTLHEFEDKDKIADEMRRVLKKGGRLLIVDFKREDTGFGPPVRIRTPKAEAIRLFEKNGFALSNLKELSYHYVLVFVKD